MNILDIERATIAAWPAAKTEYHNGWAYLATSGQSGRVNAVWPLEWPNDDDDPDPAIQHAIRWYRARKLQPRFKLTANAIAPADLEQALWNRAFRPGADEVLIMALPLAGYEAEADASLHQRMPRAFCDVVSAATADKRERAERLAIAKRAERHAAYAVIDHVGKPGAIGMLGLTHNLAGLFLMRTIPAARRQGYARRILRTLLAHAAAQGATGAYLQVEAGNAPAIDLYAAEGFQTVASYDYWSAPA